MLSGKICFITGSTRGIGWATARLFAQHRATVVINGVSSQQLLDQRVEELKRDFGIEAHGLLASVTDANATRACYQRIFKLFGRLDVLVNNAGVLQSGLLGMIAESMARTVLEVNTIGPILHMQEAARLMSRKQSGSVINVSSIMGRLGDEGQVVYAASKAAVIGMTLSAAKELAPKQIRVNAIAPGFIHTDLTNTLPPDKYEARVTSIRMKRAGTVDDVARVVLFLASDLSGYVTGQVIGVDGGMLI